MDQSEKKRLFEEFPPVSTEQWEEKIKEDLKGADYEKKLVWHTTEGIKVRPYYRAEDLKNLEHLNARPTEFPYTRGAKTNTNDWVIRQDIDVTDISQANALAVDAVKRGAEAIGFSASAIQSANDMEKLLENINAETTGIHFLHASNYLQIAEWFDLWLNKKKFNAAKVSGSFNFDPLGYVLLYGGFYQSKEHNFQQTKELIEGFGKKYPKYRIVTVNAQHYHDAGASIVQELAFALNQGNEYLASASEAGIDVVAMAKAMQFSVAIGGNYFMEIAKLRAIRTLWAKIVEQYAPTAKEAAVMHIHAFTSMWNKTIYDPYVNILRTTTEAMSAAIAGVDSMTVAPFDATYKKVDEFSSRIARNQQIILKHESYFNKVVDPSAGSYYIEALTESIAASSWSLFQSFEEKGGFITAVQSKDIYSQIEATCQKRDLDIAMRRQVFIGTNQYPNSNEKMLDKLQPVSRLTDLGELKPYRGTQAFEALRLSVESFVEKGNPAPKVFLFTFGNLAMRKARAGFSTNFFGVAGYEMIDNFGFKSIEEGVQAALKSKASIVVLCSSDEEYAEMAPAAAQALKSANAQLKVVVAGNPVEIIDTLRTAGVDDFIHVRTNVLESLRSYNYQMGII